MLAASLAGVPVRLHTVAGLPWMESKGLERFLLKQMEKATTSFSSRTYVNSAHLMAFMQQERLDPSFTKLKLLAGGSSNGIDSDYYNRSQSDTVLVDELKRKSRVSAKGFIWLFVGRLVGDKGISELVEAFSAVIVDHPNDQLWLVGPLETGHSLPERCIQAIENDPNIIHWGYQDDVRPFFAAAGALVFPSYREGFPNVPMQAAAMGCPMILSDINGCNEIVEHKKNGLLVPFKNARALYEAMVLMRNDDESAQQYVRLSLALIREKFDNKTIWKLIETEYRNLLSSNKD
jgi:glycosyltransferase involved in cell wall biosynthesis